MIKVYGVEIENANDYEGNLQNLTLKQKQELIERGDYAECYELEYWFYYLNEDMIDTENLYWFTFDTEGLATI